MPIEEPFSRLFKETQKLMGEDFLCQFYDTDFLFGLPIKKNITVYYKYKKDLLILRIKIRRSFYKRSTP